MISQEDKDAFLALLRAGRDPATAAQLANPELTGTSFRRITNETNPNYDPEFAADYLRARAEGRKSKGNHTPSAPPRTTTMGGHVKAAYISEEMIDGFLEDVSNGVPLKEAAARIEPSTTLTQLTRRANRDVEFAERYAQAKTEGYPIFQENLRSEAVRQAFNGDYRALRDQLLIHVPEFRQLLTQRHEITGGAGEAIRLVAEKALPELPPELLDQLIANLERKQLGSGEVVV